MNMFCLFVCFFVLFFLGGGSGGGGDSLSVSVNGSFAFFVIFVQVLMLISAFFLLLSRFSQKVSFTEI